MNPADTDIGRRCPPCTPGTAAHDWSRSLVERYLARDNELVGWVDGMDRKEVQSSEGRLAEAPAGYPNQLLSIGMLAGPSVPPSRGRFASSGAARRRHTTATGASVVGARSAGAPPIQRVPASREHFQESAGWTDRSPNPKGRRWQVCSCHEHHEYLADPTPGRQQHRALACTTRGAKREEYR